MNVQDFISKFRREDIESRVYNNRAPLIVLPVNMYDATKQMCQASRESRGVMLYSGEDNQFTVRHMINLGYGSSVNVYPENDKLTAANTLLQRHPELKFIDYHTHTVDTGSEFYERFSGLGGDLSSLIANVNRNKNYMHVLFTPTHILTFGLNKPYFTITSKAHPESDEEMMKLSEEFKDICSGFNAQSKINYKL